MILGVGIDVIQVDRIRKWESIPGLYERYFHAQELETTRKNGRNRVLSLAARFAAKEAFGKAIGTGLYGIQLRDINVVNDPHGKPELLLEGKALEIFRKLGGKKIHVSLTHEEDYALSIVVIEG
ncbi:MAG TPA: holo-ACP synthase [Spirochaetales bacterium]|nr:holo-ACP synthase [Spirochaetales bacterium]HOV38110.1 holo-ACP synthase [Spirochaetales bacterium]